MMGRHLRGGSQMLTSATLSKQPMGKLSNDAGAKPSCLCMNMTPTMYFLMLLAGVKH